MEDGTLYIEDYRTPQLDLGQLEPKNLRVQLPESVATELTELSFDGMSADLTAEGIHPNFLTAETISGDVALTAMECVGVSIGTGSGAAPQAMEAVTVSGEVDIALDEYVPIDVDYGTVSGNFKCTQPKYFRNGEEFSGGEYARNHTGQGYVGEPLPITVSTTSGDLTITGK